MEAKRVAVLFPGQGACYPGVLREAASAYEPVRSVLAEVDSVSRDQFGRSVTEVVWDPSLIVFEQMLADAPEVAQLAIYGTSVAVFRLLVTEGFAPDVLLGHSLGEIAALTCAGAFTVRQGAEIVCGRAAATRTAAGLGYMAALSAEAAVAGRIISLAGDECTVIAAENAPSQTILSGPGAQMDRIGEVARALNLSFFRLNSPYPFHSPLMEPAREKFRNHVGQFEAGSLKFQVFSPIMGRYYEPGDVLSDCLSQHLVRPVRFTSAVSRLYADGIRTFVEAGALDALTRLVAKSLPEKPVVTHAMLTRGSDEVKAIRDAIEAILPRSENPKTTHEYVTFLRGLGEHAGDFWEAQGDSVKQFTRDRYADFLIGRSGASVSTAATGTDRAQILKELAGMYAAALEYPEEVFTEAVELEAELGVDSVKQTELLARVSDKYSLPARLADFRLGDYRTVGAIADLVLSMGQPAALARGPASVAPKLVLIKTESVANAVATPLVRRSINRGIIFSELAQIYAAALEYPEEVFTEEVELEAELGIDSVKQTELLVRVSDRYDLGQRPADFRLSHHSTFGKIADFVLSALESRAHSKPSPGVNGFAPLMAHATSGAYSGLSA